MKMRSPPFSPEIERALRVDVSAVLLFTVFASLTTPFIGLILRRELGATPLQLSVMSAAGGACLLLSLAWARALCGHAPLPYLVWPSFVARGLFLLMQLASSAWLFVSLDRKSTRLNSSHGSISYAVFCFKKKKRKHHDNNYY